MEEELTESEDAYMKGISFHPPINWDVKCVRYPSQIRFNIRTFRSMQSKSTSIPAFVFETAVDKRDPAQKTMKVLGDRLLHRCWEREMIVPVGRNTKSTCGRSVFACSRCFANIPCRINIAVTDLRIRAPPP